MLQRGLLFCQRQFISSSTTKELVDSLNVLAVLKSGNLKSVIDEFRENPKNHVDTEPMQALNKIYKFLGNSEYGFLSGDITEELIHGLLKNVQMGMSNSNLLDWIFESVLEQERFKLPVNGIPNPDFEDKVSLFKRQLTLETTGLELFKSDAVSSARSLGQMGIVSHSVFLKQMTQNCSASLLGLLNQESKKSQEIKKKTNSSKKGSSLTDLYLPYMCCWTPQELAETTITILFKHFCGNFYSSDKIDEDEDDTINKSTVKVSDVVREIADNLAKDSKLRELIENRIKFIESKGGKVSKETRQVISEKIKKSMPRQSIDDSNTPPLVARLQVASIALAFIQKCFFFDHKGQKYPFFEIITLTGRTRRATVFSFHSLALQIYLTDLATQGEMTAPIESALPLIYPPYNRKSPFLGGYYLSPSALFRLTPGSKQSLLSLTLDLSDFYSNLDYISCIPWKINSFILNTIEQLWSNGGGDATIPERFKSVEALSNATLRLMSEESGGRNLRNKAAEELKDQYEHFSQRCDFLLKLRVAKAFSQINSFYFPHNLDFRGRAYPMPPHLNHMGNDLCRGLLVFSESKPLGERGLYWLKIHLANTMGNDKATLHDRLHWTEDNIPLFRKIIKNPLENREWTKTEDCWQALAAMNELINAIDSGNPHSYMSNIPIQQDGTCNGLQHYAAMGRDLEGSKEVNLIDGIKPGDLYTLVAKKVEVKVNNDKTNIESKNHLLAQRLTFEVKRKIVKQTVMTTVYGVTYFGARAQVRKQLKDVMSGETGEDLGNASAYIASLTLEAVKDLFGQAHLIKDWLKGIAKISVERNEPVCWITPLGIPVIQPYRATTATGPTLETILQRIELIPNADEENAPVDRSKQISAFPPNFVHSLDSTHMFFTSAKMKEKKLNFAAVHDSYWTHACDVDIMNIELRNEFVRLHSMPLLEELEKSMNMRFPGVYIDPIPNKGKLDLNEVKKSTYFFS